MASRHCQSCSCFGGGQHLAAVLARTRALATRLGGARGVVLQYALSHPISVREDPARALAAGAPGEAAPVAATARGNSPLPKQLHPQRRSARGCSPHALQSARHPPGGRSGRSPAAGSEPREGPSLCSRSRSSWRGCAGGGRTSAISSAMPRELDHAVALAKLRLAVLVAGSRQVLAKASKLFRPCLSWIWRGPNRRCSQLAGLLRFLVECCPHGTTSTALQGPRLPQSRSRQRRECPVGSGSDASRQQSSEHSCHLPPGEPSPAVPIELAAR